MEVINTINGKTPDEIKKGLECCNIIYGCKQCPYDAGDEDLSCCAKRNADVLALINQLQEDKKQLKRERDAAVEDLKKMGEFRPYCGLCAHEKVGIDEEPCGTCREGYFENNWQWRGVQEVE